MFDCKQCLAGKCTIHNETYGNLCREANGVPAVTKTEQPDGKPPVTAEMLADAKAVNSISGDCRKEFEELCKNTGMDSGCYNAWWGFRNAWEHKREYVKVELTPDDTRTRKRNESKVQEGK